MSSPIVLVTVKTVEHGIHGYNSYGCRCTVCRAAATAKVQKRRRRLMEQRVLVNGDLVAPRPAEKHGLLTTYGKWGCRCGKCRHVYAIDQQERRARKSLKVKGMF